MFEVTVIKEFAAAHKLPDYEGKCRQLHGHTWKVEITVCGQELDGQGMLVDFRDLKNILSNVLEKYDHCCLNEVAPFDRISPTAENLAQTIYQELKSMISDQKLKEVRVWESPVCCAVYRETIE